MLSFVPLRTRKTLFLNKILSVESQKGVKARRELMMLSYVPLRTRKALYIFLNKISSVESQKGVNK